MSRSSITFKASDITTTPIKLKYSASYINTSAYQNQGIQANLGINGSTSTTASIKQETINYRGIRQLYYQSYLTSSVLNSASYYDPLMQSTAYSGSDNYEYRIFPTGSEDQIYTISIPPLIFGEQISINSLELSPADKSSYRVIDDGNGNLIDTLNSNAHVGNVIYSQGLVIITNQAYTSSFIVQSPTSGIKIGNQIWSSQNLDVATYRNGDVIPQVTDPTEWSNLSTGAWCYYNNDPALGAIYGKLYNWFAVSDPRGLAPNGWSIPTFNDLDNLYFYLEGLDPGSPGLALKETGTTHWNSPNSGATNRYGFSALGAGIRSGANGQFITLKEYAFFNSTSEIGDNSYVGYLTDVSADFQITPAGKKFGYSVRLIRN